MEGTVIIEANNLSSPVTRLKLAILLPKHEAAA